MARRRTKKNVVKGLDLSGVEGRVLVPEDDYNVEVAEITQEEGDEHPYLAWKFTITDGDFEGKPLFLNTSLAPQSLWNLRNLLETLEVEIPDEAFDLDLDDMVGLVCAVRVEHEEYDGKDRARVKDFMPVLSTDEEEKVKIKGGKKGKDDEEDEELPKLTEDQVGDMDLEELEEVNTDYELGLKLSKFRTAKRKVAAVIDALDAKDFLED